MLDVLRRGESAAPNMPKPPPYVLTLTKPFTGFGNSNTAGNISGTTNSFPAQLKAYLLGTVANEGRGGDPPTWVADRVTDTETTILDPGAGLTRAQQVAGWAGLAAMRNAVNSTIGLGGTTASILTQIARAAAALTAGNYYVAVEPTADVEPAGIGGWAMTEWLRRELMRTYPNDVIDLAFVLAQYAGNGSVDRDNLANLIPPARTRRLNNGTINSLHLGPQGNKIYAGIVWRWLEGKENGGGWAPPYIKRLITGTDAATARTLNGHVFDTPAIGSGNTFTLVGGDTVNLAVNSSTGEITNNTGANLGIVQVIVEVSKGSVRNRCVMDLFVGASDTSCTDTYFFGKNGITMPDSPTSVDAQKGTFFFGVRMAPGTDGVSCVLLGNEDSGKVTIERTTANTVRLTAKNSAGTTVVSLTSTASGAGLLNEAAGLVWYGISFDINAVTPVGTMTANGVDVLSGTRTLTQGETVNYSKRLILGAQTMTRRSPFLGWVREFWMGRDYIDTTVSARRDEVFNSSTLAAVALPSNGAINGITPFFWVAGNDADKLWGHNRGTGGPSVGYILPGTPPAPITSQPVHGTFHPSDLGSLLLDAWYPPAAGSMSGWTSVGGLTRAASGAPSCVTATINTVADGVVFDGSNDFFTGTGVTNLPTGSTPGWIIGLASNDGYGDGQVRYVFARGGTANGTQRRVGKNAIDSMIAGDGTTNTSGGSVLTNWSGPAIYACYFEASQYTLRANGRQGTTTTGATLNTGTTRDRIGASTANTAAQLWLGAIAPRIELSGSATLADVEKVEGWLAWTYGLVDRLYASHTYKYSRP